jgi:hypothetical protein
MQKSEISEVRIESFLSLSVFEFWNLFSSNSQRPEDAANSWTNEHEKGQKKCGNKTQGFSEGRRGSRGRSDS